MILKKIAFEKAFNFLKLRGRKIELERFINLFIKPQPDAVMVELLKFQNNDGGFGKALEPDLRITESSALSTTIALQIIRETQAPVFNKLALEAINYLLQTFDADHLSWRMVPYCNQEIPQAPWWNQYAQQNSIGAFELNPTAEVLGYFIDYEKEVPINIIESVSHKIIDHLLHLEKINMHDFLCCKRLLETINLNASTRNNLQIQLKRLLPTVITRNPDEWTHYNLRPVAAADKPESPFIKMFEDVIDANLDYEINAQLPDGSWPLYWSWSDKYQSEWLKIEDEWKGFLIVEKMSFLKRFNKIEMV